jgi:DNA-3-methyladenine glycosylase
MLYESDYIKLKRTFYTRDTVTVAKELLGKYIFKKSGKGFLCGRIVETEAYLGDEDPACHAFRKITKRNEPMFEEGGIAYVYFIYGNYYCFNVVTEKQGIGSAVLIRGVEPISGIQAMRKYRGVIHKDCDLTNGPSKFCLAFNIDKKDNRVDLTEERIFISKPKKKESIIISVAKRIGIREGAELPYRYFIKDNPYVTKHKLNKEIITEIKL